MNPDTINSDVMPASIEVDPFTELSPALSNSARFAYLDQQAVLQADVLNMCRASHVIAEVLSLFELGKCRQPHKIVLRDGDDVRDRKSTRLNSSHTVISYAVFCLKKKKKKNKLLRRRRKMIERVVED